MPDFIDRIDELHVPPPYELGTSVGVYPYQSHGFFVRSSWSTLQGIADKYLNDPNEKTFPYYAVPIGPLGSHVFVSFNHYARSQSKTDPNKGWLAYTEVLIAYVVLKLVPGELPKALWHLPLVYIGPAQADGPGAVPIVLGREMYGFAKNPGLIDYSPTSPWSIAGARLDVYDWNPAADYCLQPTKAIEIVYDAPLWPFFMMTGIGGPPLPPDPDIATPPARPGGEPAGVHPADPDEFRRLLLTEALSEQPNAIEVPVPVRPGFPYEVRAPNLKIPVDLPAGIDVDAAVVSFFGGLKLEAPLVALRQLRDPTAYAKADFQQIVETPIVNRNPSLALVWPPVRAEFHPLNRVALGDALSLDPTKKNSDGVYSLDVSTVYYWKGELEFAKPADVVKIPVP